MTLQKTEGFPRNFGPYLLLSSLGRGGMGEVFLAKKRAVSDIDRLCIVKTLRGDLAEHGEYVRRFVDEARIVVQLNHANICQVYESGQIGSDYALAMEYIPGVNLKDLAVDLQTRGEKLEPGLALFVGEQLCEALAYAHRLKSPVTGEHLRVVHRDVSPANVMVSFEGDVKLIDFGLAESTLKTEQTETRLVMGKVAYMSPEQARGEEIDGTVDQFATAVVVYEALTGDRFYGDMNTHQVWQIVGVGNHVPRMWRGLDPDVQAVLARALAADPKTRFPSCEDFRAALEDVRLKKQMRASRATLRELMTKLYGDRREAEADLIASYADLRAPVDAGALGESPSSKAARASWETGTDPWRNSPSGTVAPAIAPSTPPGAPVHSATTPVARGAHETPLSGSIEAASASAALAPPKNSAGRALAGAAVVVVLAVAAFALWPRGNAHDAVDAGAVPLAPIAPVAIGAVPSEAADAGRAAVTDAGSAAVAAVVVDAGAEEPARALASHGRHAHAGRAVRPAERQVDVVDTAKAEPPKVETPKVETPKVEPPKVAATEKPAADAPLSEHDAEDIVHRCVGKVACAAVIMGLPKESDPAKYKARGVVLQHCAQSCMRAGVRRP